MSKVRNISGHARDDRSTGQTVEPDGLLEVPDDMVDAYTCQDGVWTLAGETKKKAG